MFSILSNCYLWQTNDILKRSVIFPSFICNSVLMSFFLSQACRVSLRLLKIRQGFQEGWRPSCARRSGSPNHESPGWRRARKSAHSALRWVWNNKMCFLCACALIRCEVEYHMGDRPASCQLFFYHNIKSDATKVLPFLLTVGFNASHFIQQHSLIKIMWGVFSFYNDLLWALECTRSSVECFFEFIQHFWHLYSRDYAELTKI